MLQKVAGIRRAQVSIDTPEFARIKQKGQLAFMDTQRYVVNQAVLYVFHFL